MSVSRSLIFLSVLWVSCQSGKDRSGGLESPELEEASHMSLPSPTASAWHGEWLQEKEELQAKQAQLWGRLDEAEAEITKLHEKTKLLEQGLAMGLIPEALKTADIKPSPAPVDRPPSPQPVPEPEKSKSQELQEVYDAKLKQAKDLYREGRYGKAYVEFAKLDREFAGDVSAEEPKYWLGRCWFNLKEYQTSKQFLGAFLKAQPKSSFAPSALYYLAQVEWKLDFKESALHTVKELLKNYPDNGNTEAAKQLLSQMQKKL